MFSSPTPHDGPDRQPSAGIRAVEEADQKPDDDGPVEKVQLRGVVEMARGEVARHRDRDGRQDLGPARAAEVVGHPSGQNDDKGHLERRQDPDGGGGEAQDGDREGGEERGQRRLVDVAEGRVAAGDDEVELVTMEAVRSGDGQQDQEHAGRGDEDEGRDADQAGPPAAWSLADRRRLRHRVHIDTTGSLPRLGLTAPPMRYRQRHLIDPS